VTPTRSAPSAACLLAATVLAAAPSSCAAPWDGVMRSVFPIKALAPGFPRECTAWYVAPLDQPGHGTRPSLPVSLYVTAGHCPPPHIVVSAGLLERTLLIARLVDPAPDLAIGARIDPRERRTFLSLASGPPAPGTRALIAGYAAGHLAEIIVTALDPSACPPGTLCFRSAVPIRGGLSGAPIVLLDTGEAAGMLVATPSDARGNEDPYTVLATPARTLLAALSLALGSPLSSASGPFATPQAR